MTTINTARPVDAQVQIKALFPRKVDLWMAGLTLAARQELKPIDLSNKKTVEIIKGSIFDTDGWQVQVVMLTAISVEGSLEIVLDPRRMMDIANGLAAAGVPLIIDMILEGGQKPIQNLSKNLNDLLRSDLSEEKDPGLLISSSLR